VSSVDQELAPPDSRSDSGERPERLDEPLRLVHHHPGYLRIHAAAFVEPNDDDRALEAARLAAEAVPGVRAWRHNPATGSVVVEYDPGVLEADDLLTHVAKRAGFRGVENSTSHKRNRGELVSVFMDTVQEVNQVVTQLAAERADLRELVPIALAATSVVSFVLNEDRGRLPHWSNAAYHSYRVFMHWHRREVRARERLARQADERATAGLKGGDAR
jgi:hypothetical protein